jgi:hypothetical protein
MKCTILQTHSEPIGGQFEPPLSMLGMLDMQTVPGMAYTSSMPAAGDRLERGWKAESMCIARKQLSSHCLIISDIWRAAHYPLKRSSSASK